MTPKELINKLKQLEKNVLKEKTNDTKTKYLTVSMFHDISRELKYRVPTPPIEISEDRHHFVCPTCKTEFDAGLDKPEDFNVCYICGQVWKERNNG